MILKTEFIEDCDESGLQREAQDLFAPKKAATEQKMKDLMGKSRSRQSREPQTTQKTLFEREDDLDHPLKDKFSATFDCKMPENDPKVVNRMFATRATERERSDRVQGTASPDTAKGILKEGRVASLKRKVMTLALSQSQKRKQESLFRKAQPNQSFYPESPEQPGGAPVLETFNVYKTKDSDFDFTSSFEKRQKVCSPALKLSAQSHLGLLTRPHRSPDLLAPKTKPRIFSSSFRSNDKSVEPDGRPPGVHTDLRTHKRAPSDLYYGAENVSHATSTSNRLLKQPSATSIGKRPADSSRFLKVFGPKSPQPSFLGPPKPPTAASLASPLLKTGGKTLGTHTQRPTPSFSSRLPPDSLWSRAKSPSDAPAPKGECFSVYRLKNFSKRCLRPQ